MDPGDAPGILFSLDPDLNTPITDKSLAPELSEHFTQDFIKIPREILNLLLENFFLIRLVIIIICALIILIKKVQNLGIYIDFYNEL